MTPAVHVVLELGAPLPPGLQPARLVDAVAGAIAQTHRFSRVLPGPVDPGAPVARIVVTNGTGIFGEPARHVRIVLSMIGREDEVTTSFEAGAEDAGGLLSGAEQSALELAAPARYEEIARARGATGDVRHPKVKAEDPFDRTVLIMAASVNGQRDALVTHGAKLFQIAVRSREWRWVAQGLEACALGGRPLRLANEVIALLCRGDLEAALARCIRQIAGGVRVWSRLGHARLTAVVVWLAREGVRLLTDSSAQEREARFRRMCERVNRLRHLGMPDPFEDPARIHRALLNGPAMIEYLGDTFGTTISKLWVAATVMARAESQGGSLDEEGALDLLQQIFPTLRLHFEALLGELVGQDEASRLFPALQLRREDVERLIPAVLSRPEEIDPSLDDDVWVRTTTAMRAGDARSARAHLERFLASNPGHGEASEYLSAILTTQGLDRQAAAVIERAVATPGGHGWVDCLAVRAGNRIDLGDPRSGAADCSTALEMDPFHPAARMFLARACLELGDGAAAARHGAIARALHPDNPSVRRFLRALGL